MSRPLDGLLRAALEAQIDGMDPRTRRHLTQEAMALQRTSKARARGGRSRQVGEPRPEAPTREWMVWALSHRRVEEGAMAALLDAPREGLVLSITRRQATVVSGDDTLCCPLATALVDRQSSLLAVGDQVGLGQRPDGTWELRQVLPRRSALTRPDPGDAGLERVIVANVDRVLVLCAAASPPPRTGLWDRVLVAAAQGGVACGLGLNKLDLVVGPAREAALALQEPYRALGLATFALSATTGEGLEGVRTWLAGGLCALVGPSGAGKSSLVNALDPGAQAQTGAVSEAVGKGRHTTTRSTLYTLRDGTRLIDTPGVRAFGVGRLSPQELALAFPELEALAARCPWSDCAHLEEQGCAVRAAAESGALHPARYAAFRRIAASLDEGG